MGKGPLIIIGGGEDKDGAMDVLKEVADRLDGGKLVVATIASLDARDEYFRAYERAFERLGVRNVRELYLHDRAEALDERFARDIEDAACIFFIGGDQLRIASHIGDTPIERIVKRIHEDGGIIAGTSAGAAVMSSTMLVKGQGAASCRVGDLQLAPGLGLVNDIIIDQHFAQRGRLPRLIGAVAQNPRVLGIGIDEDTAIIVEGDKFRILGSGAVYIVDGSQVTYSNIVEAKAEDVLSIGDVALHVLSAKEQFDLTSRRPVWNRD